MSDYTGLKQATVAYKVRAFDGAPLDINNVLTSESGNRQAIALLLGAVNPNPALYEVELIYNPDDTIDGEPTSEYSDDCVTGYIFLSTSVMILDPTILSLTVVVTSSAPWSVSAPPGGIAVEDVDHGPRNETTVTITRTSTAGQGYITFTNTVTGQTAQLYLINLSSTARPWVLAAHTWDMLGFWQNTAIWGV